MTLLRAENLVRPETPARDWHPAVVLTRAASEPAGPRPTPSRAHRPIDGPAEWRWWLTGGTLGLLLFETLSGLLAYVLPFSVFNQFGVLLHTAVGILLIVPIGWYVGVHWWRRFRGNFSHYQLLGYASVAAFLALLVSGVVLTWQAAVGSRIGRIWDLVHIVATFVLMGVLGAHLATLLWRKSNHPAMRQALRSAHRSCLWQSVAWGAVPTLVCILLAVAYQGVKFEQAFPSGYSFKYGTDRPFAPSLARTDMSAVEEGMRRRILGVLSAEQGRAFTENVRVDPSEHVGIVTAAERFCAKLDLKGAQQSEVAAALTAAREAFQKQGMIHPRQLAGSAGCGTSGCHEEIVKEWEPSAHRYASMDFVFQAVQVNMAKELAPEATRYCAGCHDPIALFSGAKNVGNETLSAEGADEGVSCLACHSMVQNDVRGNADYTVRPATRYLFEFREGRAAKVLNDFLIRAYPGQHVASYTRSLYKTAESCGACHKQFVDAELNDFGWVQGQNQYDSWRKGRWHTEGDASKTIGCRECHMPLVASNDPAAGDPHDPNRHLGDGKHRSHRFLGANQFVPRFHKLPGADEHCELTVKWLRGEYEIPEIADRWTTGPVIRLNLAVPEQAHPGEEVKIQTIITNNKAGHDFPTGPLDMIEGWVEVTVTDRAGNIVFASARPDEKGYLVNPQIVFKAELIDRLGELIGRHELWHMVGARFKRALFPGFTDTTDFVFQCPAMPAAAVRQTALAPQEERAFVLPAEFTGQELNVTAIVWYCKYNAPFLDRLFGPEARMRSEVTEIARAEAVIPVAHQEVVALNE